MDKDDAVATIKTMIGLAIATTAQETGLEAGPKSERLIDEIFKQITNPSILWVWKEILS